MLSNRLKSLRLLTFQTVITTLVILVFGLATSVLLSRNLGPVGRGEIAAAMLWPVLLIYIGSTGLISSTLYFSALPNAKTEAIFANSMALALAQSVVVMAVGFVVLPWLLASQSSYVVASSRLYLLLIPLSLATQYCMSILQGRMQILQFNFLRVIIPVGYLIGTVALLGTQRLTLKSIIVLHLWINVGVLAAAISSLLRAHIKLGWRADMRLAREMLRYGFRVQLGDISLLGNQRLDQVMIAAWLSPVQLGLYVAAVSAAGLGQLLATAVRMVATPAIAQNASANERAALAQSVFRRYWGLSLPAVIVIGLLLPIAIPRVFGADFRPAIWVAEVLLLSVLFDGAKMVLTGAAQALGRPLLSSRAEVIGLVATCLLLIVLLPLLKIMGAAIASVLASLITLIFITRGLYLSDNISPRNLFRLQGSDFRILFDQFYGRFIPNKE